MDLSDEGLYTVLADNGRGLPADARVTLAVDDALEKQIPGKVTKFNSDYIIKILIISIFYIPIRFLKISNV